MERPNLEKSSYRKSRDFIVGKIAGCLLGRVNQDKAAFPPRGQFSILNVPFCLHTFSKVGKIIVIVVRVFRLELGPGSSSH